jgi:hypothetical protein
VVVPLIFCPRISTSLMELLCTRFKKSDYGIAAELGDEALNLLNTATNTNAMKAQISKFLVKSFK